MDLSAAVAALKKWALPRRNILMKYGAGCAVAVAAVALAWFVPPLRQSVQHVWAKALPPAADTYDAASPVAQAAGLADEVDGLKEQLSQLQQAQADEKKSLADVAVSVQDARSSLAASIDAQAQDLATVRRELLAQPGSNASDSDDLPDDSDTAATTSSSASEQGAPLDINTATADQLDGLPGIGPAYAKRIVDYRDEHGDFKSVDDLDNVSGIGPATIAKIRSLVRV